MTQGDKMGKEWRDKCWPYALSDDDDIVPTKQQFLELIHQVAERTREEYPWIWEDEEV